MSQSVRCGFKRVEYEKKNRDGTQVRANVTVQGWVRPGGALRRCGDDVYINSPSAMLTGLIMKIQTLTFQQEPTRAAPRPCLNW